MYEFVSTICFYFTGSATAVLLGQEIRRLSTTKASVPGPCFPPHVTLLGGIRGFNEKEMREKTANLARSFGSPVAMRLDRIDKGNHYHQCVFILVEKSGILEKCFDEACITFDREERSEKYMPHVSLLYSDISQEERAELVEDSLGHMKDQNPEDPLPGFESDTIELWYTPVEDKTLKSWKKIEGYRIGS